MEVATSHDVRDEVGPIRVCFAIRGAFTAILFRLQFGEAVLIDQQLHGVFDERVCFQLAHIGKVVLLDLAGFATEPAVGLPGIRMETECR